MTGATSLGGAVCEACGAPGDVYVRDTLYCARCALESFLHVLQALDEYEEAAPRITKLRSLMKSKIRQASGRRR